MKNKNLYIFLFCAAAFLSGCSSSPIARYPDFIDRKHGVSSTTILTDFVIIEEQGRDTGVIYLDEIKKNSKTCLNLFAGKLNEKGYKVDKMLLTSSGLLMNHNQQYIIATTPNDQQWGVGTFAAAPPPFYISENFLQDTLARKLLKIFYSALVGYTKEKGEVNKIIPAAVPLGKAFGASSIAVLFVGGVDVPISYQLGKAPPVPNMTQKIIATQLVSQLSIVLYLVDAVTGEVIWDDNAFRKGGIIQVEKILEMTQRLVENLP